MMMSGDELSATTAARQPVVQISQLSHRYKNTVALDAISLDIAAGSLTGLIGPDGVGKSSLLALLAGVRKIQTGRIRLFGGDMADSAHRQQSCARIAYMPQGLGKNLYPTLSVYENLDFFARLFGQLPGERRQRIRELLHSTGLDPFLRRPAGKLSGGMKQKLGLCCALIHDPDLLILDEPTTGVDPLSRRQFWELIAKIRQRRPQLSVIIATAYMDEAEHFDWLAAMDGGKIIATGSPAALKQAVAAPSLEAAFIALLPAERRAGYRPVTLSPRRDYGGAVVSEARGLTMQFGDFVAVDNVSFSIARGEIFGFLGSNGCGKSTTMKMLTGLLPATSGSATVLGQAIEKQDISVRRRVGYMSQNFSLYRELTVLQNLRLHAQLFQLPEAEIAPRIAAVVQQFSLTSVVDALPDSLPLGVRQRLQLAVALIHQPEMLILDEPTSGVDPVARDQFWQYLIDLSRQHGVTIFISTHFMSEAERCDRVSFMHAGKVLAIDTPQALVAEGGYQSLEQAFIACLEQASAPATTSSNAAVSDIAAPQSSVVADGFSSRRSWAYARREALEIFRDPVRFAFALLGPLILMLAFGYGISFDVENLPFAVMDQDRSRESRLFLENFEGTRTFARQRDIASSEELYQRLQSAEVKLALEIPASFGRDLLNNRQPEVGLWLDGAMPFRAETARAYVGALVNQASSQQLQNRSVSHSAAVNIETRFRYNESFASVFAIVPGLIMLMLALVPSMMTAVGVVREIETGSIANFRATPVTRLEFLLGKQLPYLVIGLLNFFLLLLLAVFLFAVPVKGSLLTLCLGAGCYIFATTGFGLLLSSFVSTQIAAIFAAAILAIVPAVNFSGLLTPVSALSELARLFGLIFPSAWFQPISVGVIAKGLGLADLWQHCLVLAAFGMIFIALSCVVLHKQEP